MPGTANQGNEPSCGGYLLMWATNVVIETFTEYYHILKVCINIIFNLVSKFLPTKILIIVNDILKKGKYHKISLNAYT